MDSLELCLRNKGPTAAAFKLKEKVLGNKKKPQEAIAIKDPETNKLLTNRKEIMETTLKYCQKLLSKKGPSEKYEEDYESKKELHSKRINEKDVN